MMKITKIYNVLYIIAFLFVGQDLQHFVQLAEDGGRGRAEVRKYAKPDAIKFHEIYVNYVCGC